MTLQENFFEYQIKHSASFSAHNFPEDITGGQDYQGTFKSCQQEHVGLSF